MIELPLLLSLAFAAPEAEPAAARPEPTSVEVAAPTEAPSAQPTAAQPTATPAQPEPALSDPFVGGQAQPGASPDLADPFVNGQAQPAQPQPNQAGVVTTQSVEQRGQASQPQQPPPPTKERKVGFFAGFDTRLSEIDRAFATTLGGLAGVILKQRLMLGGGYYSLAFHDRTYSTLTDRRELELEYGGAQIGVYAVRSPRIDGGFNVFLGGGQLCMESSTTGSCASKTGAFVSHVESSVYIRLASILRLGFGFGYNFVVDTSGRWAGPDSWTMSGWGGSAKIEIGLFRAPKRGSGRRR